MPPRDWTEGLAPEDLPGDLRDVAERLGVETALALGEQFGGQYLYIRQIQTVVAGRKREHIRAHRERDPRRLARETGYSLSQVYRLLADTDTDPGPSLF